MKDKILKIFSSSIKIKVTGRNINNFLKRLINNNINIEKVIPISHKEIDLIINYQDLDKVLKLKTIYNIKIVRYYGKLRIIKRIKKATLLINDTFTGDIRYVTGGGSNGWTDEVNVRLLGGKVKVLQAVNRGFTLNSEMTVDGATVENAYASAEGDNLELGVTESAVLDIVSGKVTNVAPGQSGNPNETAKDIAELSYVEGTVTNGTDSFADKNITVNVRLTLTSDNIKETISVPKGTKFTDEELQQLIDEINADLKADKFKLEGFFADKELKNKFDFSKEINADTTVYLKFTELKEETTVKEEKNPATNDMNLALILASLGLASAGAVLVSRKKLAKANR